MDIRIDTGTCTKCGLCAQVCSFARIESKEGSFPTLLQGRPCMNCGHCIAVCPAGAVSSPDVATPQLDATPATYDQLLALLRMRRSRREFKADAVPQDVVEKLLDAAAQAPNGLNRQSVHYSVITDRQVISDISAGCMRCIEKLSKLLRSRIGGAIFRMMNREALEQMEDLLPEVDAIVDASKQGQDYIVYHAPCLILIHTAKADPSGPEDSVYCAANILTAVETLGLGACVIGFVTHPANSDPGIRRLARIPDRHKVHTTIALGYPRFRYSRPAPRKPSNVELIGG